MFQFEKLSVNQILVFSEIVSNSSLLQKEFIEKGYLRHALNFEKTIEFLQELDLVEISENRVTLKPKYRKFLESLKEAQKPVEITKKFILNSLINKKTRFSEYLDKFFSHFHLKDKHYEFAPSVSERLEYSGLRNFLIDLEFLYLDSSETKYIIAEEHSFACNELIQQNQISPAEFLKIQHMKGEIGRAAELKIIEYERERLLQFPDLVEKIEHTALKNVAAGYDIKSFEAELDDNGKAIARLIEVKAVSSWDYRFYWTKNEIEESELHGQSYYLYLLPVTGNDSFNLERLKVVRDPYTAIFRNRNEWACSYETLSFSQSRSFSEM